MVIIHILFITIYKKWKRNQNFRSKTSVTYTFKDEFHTFKYTFFYFNSEDAFETIYFHLFDCFKEKLFRYFNYNYFKCIFFEYNVCHKTGTKVVHKNVSP